MRPNPSPHQQFISRSTLARLFAAGLLFWLPVIVFAMLANDIWEHDTIHLDSAFLNWIHGFANPARDRFFLAITHAGGPVTIVSVAFLAVAALLWARRRRDALFVAAGVGGAFVINILLKLLFHRTRPDLWHRIVIESGYSFPSGHAMMSSAVALCLVVLTWKTRFRWVVAPLAAVYVALIGLSRMYLGVHFPTDIIAGWSVSLIWITIIHNVLAPNSYLLKRWRTIRGL